MIFSTGIRGSGILRSGSDESSESYPQLFWRSKHPETTKPAELAGHEVPAEAGGNSMIWTIISFPELRLPVKRKRRFR